jgi:hypothetical protein
MLIQSTGQELHGVPMPLPGPFQQGKDAGVKLKNSLIIQEKYPPGKSSSRQNDISIPVKL